MLVGTFTVSTAQVSMPGESPGIPDVFALQGGGRVTSVTRWFRVRRPELLRMFTENMYGRSPGKPEKMTFRVFEEDHHALEDLATRKQIAVFFIEKRDTVRIDLLLYLPNRVRGPVPLFMGLNFQGNQSITPDTAVRITRSWEYGGNKGVVDHRATNAGRGVAAGRWPLRMILERGYGVATIYAGDIAPDEAAGYHAGVQSLYPGLETGKDNFGTLSAWAWGLSRAMDYMETDPDIDPRRIAVFGWSRMGKAALWAGARDRRFAAVISNESGAGGAKLFHHFQGENIRRLVTKFPYWFCRNFDRYAGKDTLLPFDQHELVALIAPRPVYIASAEEDDNSDPVGEFMTAEAVDTVYRFLGAGGLPVKTMPAVNHPAFGRISYHIRNGGHNIKPYDWTQYLHFADLFLGKK